MAKTSRRPGRRSGAGRRRRTGRTGGRRTTPIATGSARARANCLPGCSTSSSPAHCRSTPVTSTAAIAEQRPDLVVCSQFCFGAMVAAEAAAIPFDVLLPNIYLFPVAGSTPFGLGLQPAAGSFGRTRDRLLQAVTQRMWDKGLARLNGLRAERRTRAAAPLPRPAPAGAPAVGVDVAGVRLPDPLALPASVRYVGPVLDDPRWASDATTDVDTTARRRPTRARRLVLDVPGPRRHAAAHRRRLGDACRSAAS